MKNTNLSAFIIFVLFSFDLAGQDISKLIARFSQQTNLTGAQPVSFHGQGCKPDSIHGYGFLSPTDSILGQRQIFRKYGNNAVAKYTYEGLLQQLYSIDSTAFNATGQAVFNQLWEFNEDSNAIVIEERRFCYPHAGTVQANYFFPEAILRQIDPAIHENAAFDSVILHTKNFFTGLLEPDEKTAYLYSPTGRLTEEQVFNWDAFGAMSWYPSSQKNYFYTASGRVDYLEGYGWNGLSLALETITNYTYDANDSLLTAITTLASTGLPAEKLEMAYNVAENLTTATGYTWNTSSQQWEQSLFILGDYDAQNRLKTMEFVYSFFGSTDGFRYEFTYLGNNTCTWYIKIYESTVGGNWNFVGKFYYFPNFTSPTYEAETANWSFYPNPAKDGIWVTAPQDTYLQLTTPQGHVIYKGFASGEKVFIGLKNAPNQVLLTIGQGKTAISRWIFLPD